jgi:ABC-2 type transport system ATP-binding protein
VLFLDEPTAGLDPESRNTAWEVIRGLAHGGATVLLTTQYIEEADQISDTATIINHGRILTSDTPTRLKAQLGGERLQIRLADPGAIAAIPGLQDKALPVDTENGLVSFAIPGREAGLKEVASILDALIDHGVAVDDYAIQRPTLEQAFLHLVGSDGGKPLVTEPS